VLRSVDETLAKLLTKGWVPPAATPEVIFEPPDGDAWRARVKNLGKVSLNVYLIDVRENATFRRSDWDSLEQADDAKVSWRPPAYVDAHYLVSAWSPATDDSPIGQTKDEHFVLSEALRRLLRNPEVLPHGVLDDPTYPPSKLDTREDVFNDWRMYLTTAASESSRALSEFWTTMKQPWRPAIQLIVTAPLDLRSPLVPDGPPVTTFVRRYTSFTSDIENDPNPTGPLIEEAIDFGGRVLRQSNNTPIKDANVVYVRTGRTMKTDEFGHFVLAGLRRGRHTIRVSAPGFVLAIQRDLDVPDGPLADHTFKLS
jgi:hypothetical protein